MSDTESFESVYERLYPQLHNPCGLWKAATIAEWLDDLERAHDREIRDTAQQEYHRGYGDGAHSMDAEHRAVAMRLRHLPLDGGSVENVFNIARAVYHNDFGWAANDCAALRDELVRLMGGVSDENVHVGGLRCDDGCMGDVSNGEDTGRTYDAHSNRDRNHMAVRKGVDTVIGDSDDTCDSQCCGACTTGDCGCAGEQKEVEHERATDDSGSDTGCGSSGCDLHMARVTYDVFWNERHKAVCELRKLPEWYKDDGKRSPAGRFNEALGDAIGVEGLLSFAKIRDRLIHLLGGDQPSGIDVLREMDDGHSQTCPESDVNVSENVPSASITDELREWASDRHCKGMSHTDVLNIGLIADRIDEQEHRLRKHRDGFEREHQEAVNRLMVLRRERDNLLDLLRDARDEYRMLDQVLAETSANLRTMRDKVWGLEAERDELRRKVDELESFDPETSIAAFGDDNGKLRGMLSRAATLLANAEQDRDANYSYWMDCKEKVVHANVTIEELQAKLDAIRDALDG